MKQVISYSLLFIFGNLNLYLSLIFAQSLPQVTPTVTMITPTPTVKATPVSTPRIPTVVTGDASYDDETVVLGGTVNAHGLLTTAWFEYGTTTGYYSNKSSTEAVFGMSDTHVSISIGKILGEVIYYYRIAAQNSAGISYGDERYFSLVSETPLPSSPTPSLTLSPTPTYECKAKKIKVSSGVLGLKRGQSATVVISLEGEDCVPAGNTLTATISKIGGKRISVTPASQAADENGQALFTITAVKIGTAKVIFKAGGLKKSLIMKVRR